MYKYGLFESFTRTTKIKCTQATPYKPCIEDNILFSEIDHASLTVTFTATTSFHNIYRNIFNDINKRYFLINPNVSMSLYVILYFGRIQNTQFCYCGGMRHHYIGEIRSFVKIK